MDEYLLYLKLRAGSLLHHIRALPDQFIYAGSDCSKAKQADLDLLHSISSLCSPRAVISRMIHTAAFYNTLFPFSIHSIAQRRGISKRGRAP